MSIDAFNLEKSISPTFEAKAYNWNSLCPGTQKALSKIFFWLDAACNANQRIYNGKQEELASHYESLSTSILLAGDRGSGKTTVLLSAAYAFKLVEEKKGDYFEGSNEKKLEKLRNILNDNRQKVFWLDTLDLEPLHPNTNLLASILVRIRLSIDKMDDESQEYRPSRHYSILEEDFGTGEALNRLISEATFMWEALSGSSGPGVERAEEQINAAERSAKFQNDFKDVMEKTTSLVKTRGSQQTEIFLLPIDNVDRSIEHIASISKLIRLATSKRLWFILAAVRPEYQLFLERAFQKELLRSKTSNDAFSWDQTQAIARRQAATSMRRSLPENYQIRIEHLSPYQAWTFPNYFVRMRQNGNQNVTQSTEGEKSSSSGSADKTGTDSSKRELNDLLGEIEFSSPGIRFAKFADLFNITNQLDETAKDKYLEATMPKRTKEEKDLKEIFSGAGKMALGLSMRTLLDFKAAIDLYKQENSNDWAIDVSVRMLRNAIDESNLPFWASSQLLNRIIRKDSNDKWVLDLSNNPIKRFKQPQQFTEIVYPTASSEKWDKIIIEEKLKYQEYPDIVLELHDLTNELNSYPLPPVIAGWFMILYDVLVLSEKQRVIITTSLPSEIFASVVQTSHKMTSNDWRNIELNFVWRTPQWPTFVEHFLFAAQWTAILYMLGNSLSVQGSKKDSDEENYKKSVEMAHRKLQLAWIYNICSVSGENTKDWKEFTVLEDIESLNKIDTTTGVIEKKFKLIPWSLFDRLNDDRKIVTWNWLSRELPLFLGPEFSLPAKKDGEANFSGNQIWSAILNSADMKTLKDEWRVNCHALEAARKEIVRSTVENCAAFESWTQSGKNLPEKCIKKIVNDWLSLPCQLCNVLVK